MHVQQKSSVPATTRSHTAPSAPTRRLVHLKPLAAVSDAGRRGLMLGGVASLLLLTRPQDASADTCANYELDANARRLAGNRNLDEEAFALECRRKDISSNLEAQGYGKASAGRRGAGPAPNVPVAVLDSEYAKETLALASQIEQYMTIDVYDKARVPLIKDMKVKCGNWVSKYARGGSARSQSARKMYIAVDSVTGFMASNGLAPLPKGKVNTTQKSLDEARAFLEKGI